MLADPLSTYPASVAVGATEVREIEFKFDDLLDVSEILTDGSVSVVIYGTNEDASDIKNGNHQIVNSSKSIKQTFSGFIAGTIYKVRVTGIVSLAKVQELHCILECVA